MVQQLETQNLPIESKKAFRSLMNTLGKVGQSELNEEASNVYNSSISHAQNWVSENSTVDEEDIARLDYYKFLYQISQKDEPKVAQLAISLFRNKMFMNLPRIQKNGR